MLSRIHLVDFRLSYLHSGLDNIDALDRARLVALAAADALVVIDLRAEVRYLYGAHFARLHALAAADTELRIDMELTERRLQFTPDVLPSDVVGFNMLDADGEMQYKPGAILCNILLADEINRTSTKTQSALLEVMEEGQVTVDGVTRQLPNPFVVVATQNPVGSAGTQMLPESQLDRFMIRISMGYPSMEEEMRLIKERQEANPIDYVQEIVTKQEVLEMQEQVRAVYMDDKVLKYLSQIVDATPFDALSGCQSSWNIGICRYGKRTCVHERT